MDHDALEETTARDRASAELSLDATARRALGLGPDEPVRLIEATAHHLLLARSDAAPHGPASSPVLVADLERVPLASVFEMVHSARLGGLLYVAAEGQAKSIYLHAGEVVFATSSHEIDRLGESLVRAGVLVLEQMREAERAFGPGQRFGKALVERGFVTPRELWHGVKFQVEEIVRSLFLHERGRAWLWTGDLQPDNVVRLALSLPRLVAEGLARRDELRRFVAALHDSRVRVAAVPGAEPSLAGCERTLWRAIGGESEFEGAATRAGMEAVTAARWLQLLRLTGAVRIVRAQDAHGYFAESDLRIAGDDTLRERIAAHTKLLAALAAPIAQAEGDAPFVSRFSRVVEEVAQRFPGLLGGVALGQGGVLDPEVIGARAIALGDAADDAVEAAFGELSSYLAFELRHHPAIEDAEALLREIASLRASLDL